jgi:ATP-dependent exoDNAse (exonuclease V), alpha subunit - helicase superfamily I member
MEITEKPQIDLTERQKWALFQLVNGIREKNLLEQSLGGYAGTGKTTLIKYLTKFFPEYAVAAYTGKAANVLRKKGISATTIHSRIYKPFFDNGVVYFDLNPDVGCAGFIIDEASMVSQDIYDDLKSFGLPMVFVGDHGQLEPVDSKLNLMEKPDYTLEEIHRNAGDIARFAEHLRMGFASRSFRGSDATVEFLPGRALKDEILCEVNQVICAFNKTRVATNIQIRKALGYEGLLNIGERIMCLKNNRKAGLFNGMQGIVRNLYKLKSRSYIDFEFDGEILEGVCFDDSCFGQESYQIKQKGQDGPNPFDYAYCITGHKSQGDEWDDVLVIEQMCKNWAHKRWAYTAASRAKKKLRWKAAS